MHDAAGRRKQVEDDFELRLPSSIVRRFATPGNADNRQVVHGPLAVAWVVILGIQQLEHMTIAPSDPVLATIKVPLPAPATTKTGDNGPGEFGLFGDKQSHGNLP
jgi:hypothetical protein